MKRTVLISVLALALAAGSAQAQMGSGMMGEEQQNKQMEQSGEGYPSGMGRGMMGGGMMGRGMMGRGMMGGCGMGPGMMGGGMMGGGMMGGGMMGGGMMGPGMMGPGMMAGCGMGYGMGYGCGMMGGWGDEGDFADQEQYHKFLDETAGLRKKIHDKMFEYHEAKRNPKSTVGSLNDMRKEIYGLQKELADKAENYQKSE